MLKTKSILIRYLEVEIFQAEGLKLQSSKKSVLRCKIASDSVHVVRIVGAAARRWLFSGLPSSIADIRVTPREISFPPKRIKIVP